MRIIIADRSGNEVELTVSSNGLAAVRLNGVHKGSVRWEQNEWSSTIRFDELPDGIVAAPASPLPDDDDDGPRPRLPRTDKEGLVFFFDDTRSGSFYDPPPKK